MPLANITGMKGRLRQNNVLVVFSNLSENILYMPEEHSAVAITSVTSHFVLNIYNQLIYIYIFLLTLSQITSLFTKNKLMIFLNIYI